jgi:hypothetical protein
MSKISGKKTASKAARRAAYNKQIGKKAEPVKK